MLIGLDTYRVLRELDLPFAGHRVMYWLCEHNYYGNSCSEWTQQQIADDCKLYRTRVSVMLKQLEAYHLILVLERGHCILNPYLWYRGAIEAQKEACERWDARMRERGQVPAPAAVPDVQRSHA